MDYYSRRESYNEKLEELQSRLRKSEEERRQLEVKLEKIIQDSHASKQHRMRVIKHRYDALMVEQRRRSDRNEALLRALDAIDCRAATLASKTNRMKALKKQYEAYIKRIYDIETEKKVSPLKVEEVEEEPQVIVQEPTSPPFPRTLDTYTSQKLKTKSPDSGYSVSRPSIATEYSVDPFEQEMSIRQAPSARRQLIPEFNEEEEHLPKARENFDKSYVEDMELERKDHLDNKPISFEDNPYKKYLDMFNKPEENTTYQTPIKIPSTFEDKRYEDIDKMLENSKRVSRELEEDMGVENILGIMKKLRVNNDKKSLIKSSFMDDSNVNSLEPNSESSLAGIEIENILGEKINYDNDDFDISPLNKRILTKIDDYKKVPSVLDVQSSLDEISPLKVDALVDETDNLRSPTVEDILPKLQMELDNEKSYGDNLKEVKEEDEEEIEVSKGEQEEKKVDFIERDTEPEPIKVVEEEPLDIPAVEVVEEKAPEKLQEKDNVSEQIVEEYNPDQNIYQQNNSQYSYPQQEGYSNQDYSNYGQYDQQGYPVTTEGYLSQGSHDYPVYPEPQHVPQYAPRVPRLRGNWRKLRQHVSEHEYFQGYGQQQQTGGYAQGGYAQPLEYTQHSNYVSQEEGYDPNQHVEAYEQQPGAYEQQQQVSYDPQQQTAYEPQQQAYDYTQDPNYQQEGYDYNAYSTSVDQHYEGHPEYAGTEGYDQGYDQQQGYEQENVMYNQHAEDYSQGYDDTAKEYNEYNPEVSQNATEPVQKQEEVVEESSDKIKNEEEKETDEKEAFIEEKQDTKELGEAVDKSNEESPAENVVQVDATKTVLEEDPVSQAPVVELPGLPLEDDPTDSSALDEPQIAPTQLSSLTKLLDTDSESYKLDDKVSVMEESDFDFSSEKTT